MVCKHLVGEGFLDKGTGRLVGESCKSSGCVLSSVAVATDVGLRGATGGMRCGDGVGGKHCVGEAVSPLSSCKEGGSSQSGEVSGLGYTRGEELRCRDGVRDLLGLGRGASSGEALFIMNAGRRRGGSSGMFSGGTGGMSGSTVGEGSFVMSDEESGD